MENANNTKEIIVVVSSEGFMDGTESKVISSGDILEQAYNEYCNDFDALEDYVDANDEPKKTYEEFVEEIKRNSYVFIQDYDSHIQYELKTIELPLAFNWNGLRESVWAKYRANSKTLGDGEYIGNCRVGELCFDLITHTNFEETGYNLTFDLYVGGVDTGYGYSKKEAMYSGAYADVHNIPENEKYPYDYADGASFDGLCDQMSYEEFKAMAEKRFVQFIAESKYEKADLLAKAKEPLHMW